jgi:hypothetical protein
MCNLSHISVEGFPIFSNIAIAIFRMNVVGVQKPLYRCGSGS